MDSEFFKLLNNLPDLPEIRTVLILLISLTIPYFIKSLRKIYKELIYLKHFVQASDKASEHTLGNGYGRVRDLELKKLIEKDTFVK